MNLQIFVIQNGDDTEPKVTFDSLNENEDVIKYDLGMYFRDHNADNIGLHWVYLVNVDTKQILNGKYNSEIFFETLASTVPLNNQNTNDMIHTEQFNKADATYEVRHDNSGNAIHVYFKDGELIIFPTAYDLFEYVCNGGRNSIERFYVPEKVWSKLYEMPEYNYYELKAAWFKNIQKSVTLASTVSLIKTNNKIMASKLKVKLSPEIKLQDRRSASIERLLKSIAKELPKIEKDAVQNDTTFQYQTLLWNFKKNY